MKPGATALTRIPRGEQLGGEHLREGGDGFLRRGAGAETGRDLVVGDSHLASFERLHDRAVAAFRAGGADARQAEQNWAVFGLGVVRRLAAAGDAPAEPPFALFPGTLLRGLPRHDEERRPRG